MRVDRQLNMQKLTLLLLIYVSASLGFDFSEQDVKIFMTRFDKLENEDKKLKRELKVLEDENKQLRREVKLLRDHMDEKGRRFVFPSEPPVAFTAGISSYSIDHMDPHQTIVFDKVVTDIGASYNNQTGVFTAPFSGIYAISCSLLDGLSRGDGSGVMLHAEIVKSNQVLGRIFAHAEASVYRDQGAQTVFVHVTKGEQVCVRIWDSKDLIVGGEMYSTFSGYLLWPME